MADKYGWRGQAGVNVDSKTVNLSSLGVASSTGALNFVPVGFNGAGQLKISSWSGGEFYTVGLSADGTGTYNLTSPTLDVTLPGGPEGFIYVPQGSPLFPSQSMLVSEYSAGTVGSYVIDANGTHLVITAGLHNRPYWSRRCRDRPADG